MIPMKMVSQVRQAVSKLNPRDVEELANRPFEIELFASTESGYRRMEQYFCPAEGSPARRAETKGFVVRGGSARSPQIIRVFEQGNAPSTGGYVFDPANPQRTVEEILDRHEDLHLALGRRVPPFRQPVIRRIIRDISNENALFSIATAVPFVLPLISLPWTIGEFASDTAFITVNQMRMAFQIAAASDRVVGYKEQRSEIASLIAGAFGWRTLARELVGTIPLGGGIIPKAAIAYAGTYVIGMSFERFYRLGYHMTKQERKEAYEAAFQKGKNIVNGLLASFRATRQAS